MSFLSKLFRKKPKSPLTKEQIQNFFLDESRLVPGIREQLDLAFSQPISIFKNLEIPEKLGAGISHIKLPELRLDTWKPLEKVSLRDILSEESRNLLKEALQAPGPHPKYHVYEAFLGQPEIGELIAGELNEILKAINQKLNPLSQMFKSSGLEDQTFKIIQSFVPNIQKSIAAKLAQTTNDPRLSGILDRSLEKVFDLKLEDFAYPAEADWSDSQKIWIDLGKALAKDPILKREGTKIFGEVMSGVQSQLGEGSMREIFFSNESDYRLFRDALATELGILLRNWEKETGLLSDSLEKLYVRVGSETFHSLQDSVLFADQGRASRD
jgi:hypothetical protein